MEFKFAIYTEVTDFAHQVNPEYKNSGYTRLFICPDTLDFRLVRILPGFNEEYDEEEDSIVIEEKLVPKLMGRGQELTLNTLKGILTEDNFESHNFFVVYSMEQVREQLEGGFGEVLNWKDEI